MTRRKRRRFPWAALAALFIELAWYILNREPQFVVTQASQSWTGYPETTGIDYS